MGIRYNGGKPEREPFEVFRDTISKMIEEDNKVVYIDADLMGAMKTQEIWRQYPKNIFNTGIQEANMVGVACGFYLNGFKPYVHSFTPFVTRRVFDQVFVSGAYGRKSLRIIGSDAGIMATHNGGTHMCFEDVALMRAAVSDRVKVKAAGGMRTLDAILAVREAGADRCGVSATEAIMKEAFERL